MTTESNNGGLRQYSTPVEPLEERIKRESAVTPASLDDRVATLEKEVATLRDVVERLSNEQAKGGE